MYSPNSVEFVREAFGGEVEIVFGKCPVFSRGREVEIIDEKTFGEGWLSVVGVPVGIVRTWGSRDGYR